MSPPDQTGASPPDQVSASPIDDLDDLTHQRVRLGILALVSRVGALDFTRIRDELRTTDGNLSRHLSALDEAGYIKQAKKSDHGNTRTWISIEPAGREALQREANALRRLLEHLDAE